MGIKENVSRILSEIPKEVILVAAVKYANIEQIKELVEAGVTELGFNTYQQMVDVKQAMPGKVLSNVNFHFIGHLQSNKVRKVMKLGTSLIQSIDSYHLAEKMQLVGEEEGLFQDILVQVKTDDAKEYGIPPLELEEFLLRLKELDHLSIRGLMTIPHVEKNPEDARKYFAKMSGLFEKSCGILGTQLDYLSMGMSDDYKIAIEEGANMIRLGRILFKD